jgi:hypothetical protein
MLTHGLALRAATYMHVTENARTRSNLYTLPALGAPYTYLYAVRTCTRYVIYVRHACNTYSWFLHAIPTYVMHACNAHAVRTIMPRACDEWFNAVQPRYGLTAIRIRLHKVHVRYQACVPDRRYVRDTGRPHACDSHPWLVRALATCDYGFVRLGNTWPLPHACCAYVLHGIWTHGLARGCYMRYQYVRSAI